VLPIVKKKSIDGVVIAPPCCKGLPETKAAACDVGCQRNAPASRLGGADLADLTALRKYGKKNTDISLNLR
jgi:hypothetical protein